MAAGVRILDAAERIAVFGIGPSSALASYVSTLLARSGRRSRTIGATGFMLADQLLDLVKGDALGVIQLELRSFVELEGELYLKYGVMTNP